MKFYPVTTAAPDAALKSDYDAGRSVGNVQLGNAYLFFKEKRKLYYIAYAEMTRVFRRVMLVQTKMCCGKGNLEVEYLVVCTEAGEVAQIQLAGARAGVILLEELPKRAPHVQVGKPN